MGFVGCCGGVRGGDGFWIGLGLGLDLYFWRSVNLEMGIVFIYWVDAGRPNAFFWRDGRLVGVGGGVGS